MTTSIGLETRLTREVLEAATEHEREQLRAARMRQVEQLRPKSRRSRQDQARKLRGSDEHLAPAQDLVDASRSRMHLQQLHASGYSAAVLSALTDTDQAQVLRLLRDPTDEWGSERVQRWIHREREQRILQARFDLDRIPDTCRVPGWPTRRRVQALMAIGWSLQQIADRAGVTKQAVASAISRDDVSAVNARRYRDIYDQLQDTPGPSQRTITEARRHGWPPPAAWDEIDNIAEQPDPSRWVESTGPGSSKQRIYVDNLEDCASWGLDVDGAAERLGVTKTAIEKCATRAERRDILQRLHANHIERSFEPAASVA